MMNLIFARDREVSVLTFNWAILSFFSSPGLGLSVILGVLSWYVRDLFVILSLVAAPLLRLLPVSPAPSPTVAKFGRSRIIAIIEIVAWGFSFVESGYFEFCFKHKQYFAMAIIIGLGLQNLHLRIGKLM